MHIKRSTYSSIYIGVSKSKSKSLQKKFTPEETAAIVSSTKCPIAQWIKCALLTTKVKVKVLSFVSKKYAYLE